MLTRDETKHAYFFCVFSFNHSHGRFVGYEYQGLRGVPPWDEDKADASNGNAGASAGLGAAGGAGAAGEAEVSLMLLVCFEC